MPQPIVASFDSLRAAQQASERLQQRGIPEADISLVSNASASDESSVGRAGHLPRSTPATMRDDGSGAVTGAAIGGAAGGLAGLAAGLAGLAIPGVGPVLAAGALFTAAAGAGAGVLAGGLIGALTDAGVPEGQAHSFAESVRRGGTLLVVATRASNTSEIAALMRECGAVDIDARSQQWRTQGWERHDPQADPLDRDRIERERAAYRSGGSLSAGLAAGSAAGITSAIPAAASLSPSLPSSLPSSMAPTQSPSQSSPASTSSASLGSSTSSSSTDADRAARLAASRGIGDWSAHEPDFRRHHGETYAGSDYDQYADAYQFGGDQHQHAMYRDRRWEDIESDVQRDWESRQRGGSGSTWDSVENAVRYGWERTKDAVEYVIPGDRDRDGR